jgi:hypothetical protein
VSTLAETIVIVLLIVIIGLSILVIPNLIINKVNNIVLTDDLNGLISNQAKLLSSNYLATSSNNLLIQNQKQFVPAIPTIHTTLSHVEKILNATEPIILRLGNQSNNTAWDHMIIHRLYIHGFLTH